MLALSGEVQLCVSDAVFAEYDEVIRRPQFKRAPDVIESALQAIRKLGHWVKPSVRVEECTDPDDNIFLECAQAAEADYLVTGNRRHFPD
jgi:putative PIN family toxin of toxin-antitoxin system